MRLTDPGPRFALVNIEKQVGWRRNTLKKHSRSNLSIWSQANNKLCKMYWSSCGSCWVLGLLQESDRGILIITMVTELAFGYCCRNTSLVNPMVIVMRSSWTLTHRTSVYSKGATHTSHGALRTLHHHYPHHPHQFHHHLENQLHTPFLHPHCLSFHQNLWWTWSHLLPL